MKVTAGIFRKDDCVLLMRRAQTEPLAGEWEYPGGKFEEGESGPVCLQREFKEELGIDAKIGDFKLLSFLQTATTDIPEKLRYLVGDVSQDIVYG